MIAALSRAYGNQSDLNFALLSPIPDAVELLNRHRVDHPVNLDGCLRLFADVAAVLRKSEVFRGLGHWHFTPRATAFFHVKVTRNILSNRNSRRHVAQVEV